MKIPLEISRECGVYSPNWFKLGPNPRDIFQTGKNIYEMHENRVNILPKNSKLFCIQKTQKSKEKHFRSNFLRVISKVSSNNGAANRTRTGTESLQVDFKSTMSTYSIIAAYSIPPMEGYEFGGMFWRDIPKQRKIKTKKSADCNHFSN